MSDTKDVEQLIAEMVAEAERLGGMPAGGRRTLRDSVTVEAALDIVLLWYNKGPDTRVLMRQISTDHASPSPA